MRPTEHEQRIMDQESGKELDRRHWVTDGHEDARPAPVSGDMISREAVIAQVATWANSNYAFDIMNALRALSVAPSVTVEQLQAVADIIDGWTDETPSSSRKIARLVLAALGLTVKE